MKFSRKSSVANINLNKSVAIYYCIKKYFHTNLKFYKKIQIQQTTMKLMIERDVVSNFALSKR